MNYVTIVAQGGTPVQICNVDGSPVATTGVGALVFANGPVLKNPVLDNPTIINLALDIQQLKLGAGTLEAPALTLNNFVTGLYSTGPDNLSVALSNGAPIPTHVRVASFDLVGDLTILRYLNTVTPPALDDTTKAATTQWVNDAISAIPPPPPSGVTALSAGTGLVAFPEPIIGVGSIALANTSVAPGTYGDATVVSRITVDQQGRITSASDVAINFPPSTPTGPAGGALSGTYPNPGLAVPYPTTLPPNGPAGGVLSGTYPNPGLAVPYPTTLPPNGPAGGDLAGTYPDPTIKASVALTGNPTAPTPVPGDNDTSIATTAFVQNALPGQSSFQSFRTTNFNIPNGSFGTVVFDGVLSNIGGYYNAATGEWTPPSGTYQLNLSMTVVGGANNQTITMAFFVNGASRAETEVLLKSTGDPGNLDMAVAGTIAPGDVVTVRLKSSSAGAVMTGGTGNNWFQAFGIGGAKGADGATGPAGPALAFVGIAPPALPMADQLWWNSELGQMFIYYNDGNTTQWVPAAPATSVGAPLLLGRAFAQHTAFLNIATNGWPADGSAPIISLGTQIISLPYTIKATGSKLRIKFTGIAWCLGPSFGIAALFRDGATNAIRAGWGINQSAANATPMDFSFDYTHGSVAGTVATFTVRCGGNSGSPGISLNGNGTIQLFTGTTGQTLEIEEYI